ncbi:hypothetical protein GPALN_006663 [Globodera pallida]|nr:hypothetical protein GPALN_006663 [Globodera pallida]
MFGRHRCLLTCTYIVLLLLSHVLAAQRDYTIEREDGKLMAYKGGVEIGDYATYAATGIAAGAASGAVVGAVVGTLVPIGGIIVGGALGALFGGTMGFALWTSAYSFAKGWCEKQCADGTYACVAAKSVSMACCNDNFNQQCYSDWAEIEAKYPRLTTPRPIQPPVIVIYNPDWAETFSGPGIKEDANLTKVTTFWCKRARRTFLKYLVAGNTCPYESNQCYFAVCIYGKADGNRHVVEEWGCVPKNTDFCGRISSPCNCTLAVPDVAMGNENQQFEELSG